MSEKKFSDIYQPIFLDRSAKLLSAFFIALTVFSLNSTIYAPAVAKEVLQAELSDEASLAVIFNKHFLLNEDNNTIKRAARTVTVTDIKAPAKTVMEVLSDFSKMPAYMKRVKTVEVRRQEGNFFYTESYLKPQLFVSQTCNHTITQLSPKPNTIDWVLIDGNFPSASGRWQIDPQGSNKQCRVTYTVAVDPGQLIPTNIAAIGLRLVQKEVINGMKERAEEIFRQSSLSKHQNNGASDYL